VNRARIKIQEEGFSIQQERNQAARCSLGKTFPKERNVAPSRGGEKKQIPIPGKKGQATIREETGRE